MPAWTLSYSHWSRGMLGVPADLNCFDSFKCTAKSLKGLHTEALLSTVHLWREPSSVQAGVWENFTVRPAGPWTSVFVSPS